MPLVATIGNGVQTSGETTFTWNIRDFFSLSDKVDDFYNSPSYSFADSRWYLRFHPNGQTFYSSAGSVGLYLYREDSGECKTIEYTLGIKCSDGVEEEGELKYEFTKANTGYGFPEFYARSQLQNQASRLTPNDVLVITCHMKYYDPIAAKVSLGKRDCKVISNMKTILEEGKRVDFTLKLGDREWPVHKVILESRCEYFENMFRHDWIENNVGEVKLNDIEEDALDCVLQFIYTDAVEDMSVKNVCEIYVAAHKFLLDDLKELCIEYIKQNMCVEIVCNVLVVADIYGEKVLNETAIEYFTYEASKIFDSEEWKELKKNHLSIATELLEETTKRKNRTK